MGYWSRVLNPQVLESTPQPPLQSLQHLQGKSTPLEEEPTAEQGSTGLTPGTAQLTWNRFSKPQPHKFKGQSSMDHRQKSERHWISSAGIYRTTPLHRELWLPSLWFHKQQKSCLRTNVHPPTPLQELIPVCTSHPLRTGTAFPTPERLTRWGKTDLAEGKEIHFCKVGWDAHLAHRATTYTAMARGDGTISWHPWQSHCSGNTRQSWMPQPSCTRSHWKLSIKQSFCREQECPPHTSDAQTCEALTSNHAHQPSTLTANPLGYFPVHDGAHHCNRDFNSNAVSYWGLVHLQGHEGRGSTRV